MQHVAYFYDTRGVSLVRQRTGLRRLLVGLFLASSLAWTRSGERAHGTHRAGERVLRFGSRQVVPFFNPASKSDFRNRDQPRAGGQRKTVLVLCPSESDQTFRVFFFSLSAEYLGAFVQTRHVLKPANFMLLRARLRLPHARLIIAASRQLYGACSSFLMSHTLWHRQCDTRTRGHIPCQFRGP